MTLRFMIALMVVGVVLTIAAIVEPVAGSGHSSIHAGAQSSVAALMAEEPTPVTDQPEIGAEAGEFAHIPAGLIASDLNDLETADPAAVRGASVTALVSRASTWIKGYDPPP